MNNVHMWSKMLVWLVLWLVCGVSSISVSAIGFCITEPMDASLGVNPDLHIDGAMGENGWYISDVLVTITGVVNHTYYRIDSGDWSEYTVPFAVGGDGFHVVECMSGEDYFGYVFFKIDGTVPQIQLVKQDQGNHVIRFVADVYDATSGLWRVDFYLDDVFAGTDDEFPFLVFKWIALDWHPAKEPYDIPGVR
jgi:hypothetical protein